MKLEMLVVDDDPLVLRSVEKALARSGYVVHTAHDVASSLRILRDHSIDGALVDYALGREDGLAILSALREGQPGCLRVLMTGRADFPMVVEAMNRGDVVRVLRKPFQSGELLALLDDAFAAARRLEEVNTARQIRESMAERRMIDQCLDESLLRLALQPIWAASGPMEGRAVAYEALLRPQHPVLSTPLALIQASERHDRVLDVGAEAIRLSAEWLDRISAPVKLFINLHPDQLGDPRRLEQDLASLAHAADRVTLEITERSRLQDIQGWEDSVRRAVDAGFSIAIDDLGAGYSSLIMLADLQPDYIKLDMSLVRNLHLEPRKQRLVQLMVTFAEATQALTIAEGVETAEEAAALRDCGIHLVQGYYYGRPSLSLVAS